MSYREAILEQVHHLPPIPHVAAKVSALLTNPEISAGELVETVKYDPGLTARIIRMSNSTYMGGSGKIKTLNDALVRLGNKQIHSFVVTSTVKPMLNEALEGYGLSGGEMWKHSVAVAVAADLLEEAKSGGNREIAFTAGMLHDIGKLALDSFVEQEPGSITRTAHAERRAFQEQEEAVLGMNHNEAGAELLRLWEMPEELITVTRWHHEPDRAERDQHLVDLIHLADTVSMSLGLGLGDDGLCYELSKDAFERMEVDEKLLQKVAAATLSKIDLVEEMFNMENGGQD